MDGSPPGFLGLRYLQEPAQTHVHWVGDAIQLSHPLLPLSPLALDLSQHQGLFQWIASSHQVAKVLELQLQHQSFQFRVDPRLILLLKLGLFRIDFLQDWLVWFPCCPRAFQESSPAPEFQSINSLMLSFLYGPALGKTIALTLRTFKSKAKQNFVQLLSSWIHRCLNIGQ